MENLRRIVAFRFLRDEELDHLSRILTEVPVQAGETVVREFSKGPEIYFIARGTFNVVVQTHAENEAYISALGEGDCFSESGLFPEMPRNASVIAAEEGTLYRLVRKDLLQFLSQHPAGGIKFLMMIIYSLLRKLRMVNRELAYERTEDSDQRDIDALVRDFMNAM